MGIFSLFTRVRLISLYLVFPPDSFTDQTSFPSLPLLLPLQTKEVDYDTYLSLLQDKITARQSKLQQIRLRERRTNALFITYGLALWVVYGALWYFGVVGSRRNGSARALEKGLGMLPMVLGPVV